MSGSQINFDVTVDVASAVDKAAQIQQAFLAIGPNAQTGAAAASAALTNMGNELTKLTALHTESTGKMKKEIEERIAALRSQINITQMATEALQGMKSSTNETGDAVTKTSVNVSEFINNSNRLSDTVSKASASAKVFETTLGTLGLSATETAIAMQNMGIAVTTLSGQGLQTMIDSLRGVRTDFRSASSDGSAFATHMDEIGVKVKTLATRDLRSLVDNLTGVRTNFKSASSDGSAFATQMDAIGNKVRTVASRDLQELISRTTGLNQEMRTGSDVGRALASQFGNIEAQSTKAAHGMRIGSSSMQEMERIARALLTGEFSLLPGELMTLTTRLGGVPGAVFVAIGAFAALAIAADTLYNHLHKLNEERLSLNVGAALELPDLPGNKASEYFDTFRRLTSASSDTAKSVVESFTTMRGGTSQNIEFFLGRIRDLTNDVPEKMTSIASSIKRGFESPMTESMNHALLAIGMSDEAIQKMNAVVGEDAPYRRRILLMDMIDSRANEVRKSVNNLRDAQIGETRASAAASALGENASMLAVIEAADTQRASDEYERLTRNAKLLAESKANVTNRTRESATAFESWGSKAAKAGDEAATKAYDEAGAEERATLRIVKATQARVTAWEEMKSKTTSKAESDDADRKITNLRMQLAREEAADRVAVSATMMERLRLEYVSDSANFKDQIKTKYRDTSDYHQAVLGHEIDFYTKKLEMRTQDHLNDRQVTALETKLAELRGQLSDQIAMRQMRNSKRSLQEQIADLNMKQAEAGKDYQEVMRIEDLKINYLRSLGKEGELQLKNELRHKAELQNRYTEELLSAEQTTLMGRTRIDTMHLEGFKRNQDALYRANLITEKEMTANVIAETQSRTNASLLEFELRIAALPDEVKMQAQTAQRIREIRAGLTRDIDRLKDDEARKDEARARSESQMWEQAASKIGSSMGAAFTGLVTRQTTMQQAMRSVITSMISDFVSMCTTMAARWAVLKIAQVMGTTTANAVIKAQDAGMSSGFGALVTAMLTKWGFLEEAKTTATGIGTATRVGLQAGESTEALALSSAEALGMIGNNAGVAASGAAAAVAPTPWVGPALAAAAFAATMAMVLGSKSMVKMDVGAWNVPKDMPAYIHQGEMVVPKNFAEGIRSGMGGSGGGGGGGTNHYHFSPSVSSVQHGTPGQTLDRQVMASYNYFRNIARNGAIALPGRPA